MPTISPARIGIDVGRKLPLEDAVDWAATNDVGIIDIQLDTGANVVTSFDQSRAHAIRRSCDHHDIRLGLHTLSAVNVAEYAPLVADAVDAYLKAYIDAAVLLGAEWIVVHAGFHFSADIPQRMQAGLDRLNRVADYAASKSVLLLLENLNKEPPDAEVHYLAVPLARVREVRLADCRRNGHEEHLNPGQGDFDFPALFKALEANGYDGHYMNAFGSLDDMLQARTLFAGIAVA
jgi:sugar phosphate isomerase/epimerase